MTIPSSMFGLKDNEETYIPSLILMMPRQIFWETSQVGKKNGCVGRHLSGQSWVLGCE